jgi:osmotically-inducible protein OsmY
MAMNRRHLLTALLLVSLLTGPVVAGCSGETAGEYVDDSVISNTVRAKLLDDKDLNIFQIDVSTLRGEVQLSGFVGSQADKDRAGSVAATVDGVRKVHNNLVIQ